MATSFGRTLSMTTLLVLGACAGGQEPAPARVEAAAPAAPEALAGLPVRGDGPSLPGPDAVLTRIAVGSSSEESQPIPILAAVAAAQPQLFLLIGDNVHGNPSAGDPAVDDPALPGLRQAYGDLNLNAHFAAFNMSTPMLATWDDQDSGVEHSGAEAARRALGERIFETYWGPAAVGTDHPGVYGARAFGPPGKRVRIIMLDTRSFRSPAGTVASAPSGRRRRAARSGQDPTMLGEAQWRWLEAELRKPAEIRLLVSSVQVQADTRAFGGWATLPAERQRLYETIRASGAKGVVMLSGDRRVGVMHRAAGLAAYSLAEMTTSPLNLAPLEDDTEWSPAQIGRVYTPNNFGLVEIDWTGRTMTLSVRGLDGAAQRSLMLPFRELGL